MSKYEKLGTYLARQPGTEIPMTFDEIERIIGCPLPRSSRYPAWWSNNPSNNVMTRIWLEAGFKTEQVSIEGRKLVFRRIGLSDRARRPEGAATTQEPRSSSAGGLSNTGRPSASEPSLPTGVAPTRPVHPAFGSMKSLITVAPGTDLTEPPDPDWGRRLDEKHRKDGKPS